MKNQNDLGVDRELTFVESILVQCVKNSIADGNSKLTTKQQVLELVIFIRNDLKLKAHCDLKFCRAVADYCTR